MQGQATAESEAATRGSKSALSGEESTEKAEKPKKNHVSQGRALRAGHSSAEVSHLGIPFCIQDGRSYKIDLRRP